MRHKEGRGGELRGYLLWVGRLLGIMHYSTNEEGMEGPGILTLVRVAGIPENAALVRVPGIFQDM